jgi:hypothetical protein
MAGRDEYGGDSGPCPDGDADDLVLEHERGAGTPRRRQRAVLAHEARLGAARTGRREQQPRVAREAEAPGVSQTLAVEEDGVGSGLQPGEGGDERRDLAEAEEAGDVGKPRRPGRGGRLDEVECRQADDDHRGVLAVRAWRVGDVGAGDQTKLAPRRREAQSPPQRSLDLQRLSRRHSPRMQRDDSHRSP